MGGCMGRCMGGEWVHGGGDVVLLWWGWEKCMGILPGLVWLDFGIGGGLVGDGEEVIGVVS